MTWIVQPLTGAQTAHDTRADAEAEQRRLGNATSVVWECDGIEEVSETPTTAPVAAEGVVERVLGHLGFRTATTGEIR